jgi:hypothetical protein
VGGGVKLFGGGGVFVSSCITVDRTEVQLTIRYRHLLPAGGVWGGGCHREGGCHGVHEEEVNHTSR